MLELSQADIVNVCGGDVVDKSDPLYKVGHAIGETIKAVGEVAAVAALAIAAFATGEAS
ncbi:hypothetical protein ACVCL0_02930 [Rhodanobacter sp. UC4450_H17]|jgi:hypothetical protein|nr:hypothetical protein [Rhodanobacter sp.]